jgi:autotransporter-associated beta strand protein
MKSKYSNLCLSSTRQRAGVFSKAIILCFGGAMAGMWQSAQAADVLHTLTAVGDGTWTGATWTNGAPTNLTAGDVATAGVNSTTTLNADVTIGSLLDTGSGRTWTINSNATNVLTMDGTGISSGNNGFGHAGVASLRINTTGAGVFIVNPDIRLATNTDIGTTSGDDEVVINGNISATSAVNLNFQNNVASGTSGSVATAVNGSIGASGSNIAITVNSAGANGGDPGTVTLNGILGSSVTTVTQNSASTVLNLNGANLHAGGTVVNLGTLTVGAAGTLGATTGTLAVNNTTTADSTNVVVNLSTGLDTTTGSLSGTLATPSSGVNTATINTQTDRTFTVNQTTDGVYQGAINGSGSFTLGSLSTSTLTLSGTSNYTGATTINAGGLNVTGALSGTTAVAVNGGTTLKGSGTITGAVTVAAGNTAPNQGTIDLTNASAAPLTLGSDLTIGGASAGLVSNLKFDVGGTVDSIAMGSGVFTVDAGGANLSLTNIGGVSSGQSYDLITFASGAGAGFSTGTGTTVGSLTLTTPSLTFGVTGTLNVTNTAVQLVTSGAPTPTVAYWKGTKGTTWAANSAGTGNFTTNAAGTTFVQAYPAATTDVIFSATGATNFTHTLGQPFAVNSVTFVSPSAVTINADGNTLNVGSGGLVVQSGAGAVSIGANLTGIGAISNAGTLALSGAVSTSGGIINTGTMTLSGTNSFTGGIVNNSGTLTAGSSSAFAGNDLSVNAGTVNLNGNSPTIGLLTGNVGAVITNNTTGTATLTVNNASDSTYSGALQDGGVGKVLALTKTGAGTLTLTAANSYSGATNINAGIVQISAANNLGNGSATNNIGLNGGTLQSLGGSYDLGVNRGIVLSGSGTLLVDAGALTASGPISGSGTLAKAGAGALILAGNSTYTGSTTYTDGTLQLQANAGNTAGVSVSALGASTLTSFTSGLTLQLRGDTTGVTFAGFGNGSSGTLLSNGSSVTFDVNQLSSGSAVTLGVGGFRVQNSTINVTGGNGYTLATGGLIEDLANNGTSHTTTFNPTTANLSLGALSSINGTAGTSTMTWVLDGTSADNFVEGVINNGQSSTRVTSVIKSNTSTWTLTGANTYLGNTTINAGTLTLADTGGLRFQILGLANNKVTGAGIANLNGAFTFNLAGADLTTGNTWTIVDTTTKTFGSTFSVVDFEDNDLDNVWTRVDGSNTWTFDEATGILTLASVPSSQYAAWATLKGLTVGVNDGPTQDNGDYDSVPNVLEFVLGGNPLASDPLILPDPSQDATNFYFTFNRADESEAEVGLTFQYGSNLTGWTDVAIGATSAAEVTITENDAAPDTVVVTIPKSSAVGGKLFGRLNAVK